MAGGSAGPTSDLMAAFRSKVEFMSKQWTPQSPPSSRDRLELYALHKQAVSGDAPSSFSTTASSAERSKYQSWRSKSGTSQEEAMRLYLQEADRQIRVYGSKGGAITASSSSSSSFGVGGGGGKNPATASSTNGSTPQTSSNGTTNNDTSFGGGGDTTSTTTPRGLAAIPLLCAAAAESRQAYIRRLSQTQLEAGWWQRQEPLCSPPGSLGGLPESMLLIVAKLVERVSLTSPTARNLMTSFLWPVHNSLLALWMLLILYLTTLRCAWNTVLILVWGSRRTGISLSREWDTNLTLVAKSISAMVEKHQSLTVRLVGLTVLPIPTVFNMLKNRIPNMAVGSVLFDSFLVATWWYWIFVVPFLMTCLVWTAVGSGACFAIIEFAGL
jgi:acyl-CoA-binding protein